MPLKFSLIICTYQRPMPLLKLLDSVKEQTVYPHEVLIIDGSIDDTTKRMIKDHQFKNLKYYKVDDTNRGLTRQRNYGIARVDENMKIICFLDDDIVLTKTYFEELISTYEKHSDALAVGGYILNDVEWKKLDSALNLKNHFVYDGWSRTEPFRFKIRGMFGLLPDTQPGFLPTFSHGRSVGFLPPSGKVYEVEQFMGGVSSYRKKVFNALVFSNYFEGYGLYEDADFCFRLSKLGKLYVNTKAQLYHYHDDSGRPNRYKYGKMVIRNGWYVWRVKYSSPDFKARFKWHATALLLTLIRFTNVFTTNKKMEAFTEGLGRVIGWWSLIFNRPRIER